MRLAQTRLHLFFKVKYIYQGRKSVPHTQPLVLYDATQRGEQTSVELKRQSEQYERQYYVAESICRIRKKKETEVRG